ncbi:hypothetical protein GH714_021582 [Hevea brasiliensis]|uniref:Large ribosomal subunit protein uL3c n=1 Tax=Hevea brasiliensis TaxID=3981 RepID=A0A6A6M2R1_HEVBR|nr:hypothetical protein GH714_021582 [Hevea brasiliensis]
MSMDAGVGVMGTKLGMMSYFEPDGTVVPVTVVGFREGNIVTQIRLRPLIGIIPMRHLQEFRLQNIDGFEVGQKLVLEELFKEGDLVDVSGINHWQRLSSHCVGTGICALVLKICKILAAGLNMLCGIKRHNFKRGQMTHGSKSHRALGSIGAGTTPGRVYKGKKMPGRMGGTKTKIRKLKIVKIDNDLRADDQRCSPW